MNKKLFISLIGMVCIFLCKNVFADGFNADDYTGIYYCDSVQYKAYTGQDISKGMSAYSALNSDSSATVNINSLKSWINGKFTGLKKISYDEMNSIRKNLTRKDAEENMEKFKATGKAVTNMVRIGDQAGSLTVVDDSGNVLGEIKRFKIEKYQSDGSWKSMMLAQNASVLYLMKETSIAANGSDFWGAATIWFNKSEGNTELNGVKNITDEFENMINVVGTTVIVVATIVLGIKYIIGTVESRTSAKEGLITLFVACVFFFGWTSISNILFPGNKFVFTNTDSGIVTGYAGMVGRLFSTFVYFANIVVILAIIYVGVRYILAGAEGRSELKSRSPYLVIGIILAFATINVLNLVSNIITETLTK